MLEEKLDLIRKEAKENHFHEVQSHVLQEEISMLKAHHLEETEKKRLELRKAKDEVVSLKQKLDSAMSDIEFLKQENTKLR